VAIQPRGLPGPLRRFVGRFGPAQSEDCLSLNVFTPDAAGGQRPVMVWIHGGGFTSGSSGFFLYRSHDLVRRGDVVLVTLNYRLGALGALDLRAFGAERGAETNVGLRDQLAALAWVRENIAAFGGDPENITLFGQSAGAMSIAALLSAPAARGTFQRAILQSGAARNVLAPHQAAEISEQLLRELDLHASGSALLEALRRLPAGELLRAQTRVASTARLPLGMLAWQPVVDGDVIPVAPECVEAGEAAPAMPILIGTNADEWKLYTIFDAKRRTLSEERLRDYVARTLEKERSGAGEHVDRVLEIYSAEAPSPERDTPGEIWAAIQRDRVFRLPALALAERHAASGAGAYVYRFDYRPALAPMRVGACHAVEIPFVFGSVTSPLLRPLLGFGESPRVIARRMQDAWIAFARSGDPSGDAAAHWPMHDVERRSTRIFGERDTIEHAPGEASRRFWAELRGEDAARSSPA
jgi:para-nitrobenzyl esterase